MTIDERRHELYLMSHEELLAVWQRATGATDEDTTKKTYQMIQEILAHEFRDSATQPM